MITVIEQDQKTTNFMKSHSFPVSPYFFTYMNIFITTAALPRQDQWNSVTVFFFYIIIDTTSGSIQSIAYDAETDSLYFAVSSGIFSVISNVTNQGTATVSSLVAINNPKYIVIEDCFRYVCIVIITMIIIS